MEWNKVERNELECCGVKCGGCIMEWPEVKRNGLEWNGVEFEME